MLLNMSTNRGIDRSTHRCGLGGKSLTRLSYSSRCLGGHCKYASPRQRTSVKQRRRPNNQRAEKSEFVVEVKEKNKTLKASQKIVVSIDRHPTVVLCDISQNFDAFSQNQSYTLPDVLKTKVVHCFKQEMRAGFRFEPGLFGRNKNSNEESTQAESQQICTTVPSQGPSLEPQTPRQDYAWALSIQNADPSFNSWARGESAKHTSGRMVDLDGEASEALGIKEVGNRKPKLTCTFPAKINTSTNDDGQSGHVSRSSGSREENGIYGKFCNDICTSTNSDASGMSPGGFCQNNKALTDEQTNTCQRVRVYFRKTNFSCARTDMPWPLLNTGLTRKSHTATPACLAPSADPSDTISSPISTNKQDSPNGCPNKKIFNASEGPSSGSTQWINHQMDDCRGEFLTGENGGLQGDTSSHSPDSTNIGFAPNSLLAEETRPSPPSDGPRLHRSESSAEVHSPLPRTRHRFDHSRTSPSPTAVVLSDMERTNSLYSTSSPSSFQLREVASVSLAFPSSPRSITKPLEKQLFFSEDAQMISCSPPFAHAKSCDSFHSSESSLLLPQDKQDCNEESLSCPPKLLSYSEGSPMDDENTTLHSFYKSCRETDIALPPMLSPINSPHGLSWRSVLSWSTGSSDRNEEEDICAHKIPTLVNDNANSSVDLQRGFERSGKVLKMAPLTQAQFSPSSGAQRSSPSSIASSESDRTCEDVSNDLLDEVTAYKQDILLVDVTQDDAELFDNLPEKSLLKLGPVRVSEPLKHKALGTNKKLQPNSDGASVGLGQRSTAAITNYSYDSADDTEESNKRPWRPQSSSSSSNSRMQSSTWPANETRKESTGFPDANNNQVNKSWESRTQVKSLNPLHSHSSAASSTKNGPCFSHSTNSAEFRHQKSNSYCFKYFSEFMNCGFKVCRFKHVPLEGDEKFCVETILRFTKNPKCLHKARAVFTSYYLNNPPGAFFSMSILSSLLWALLKAGMVSDIFSILSVSVTHKIVPGHEFVLALFNFVREKEHVGLVPELMQLTFKMAAAGLVLNFDWMDSLTNNGEAQASACANSNSGKGAVSGSCLGYLNVAQAVVEIELCTKLEDWKRTGDVFLTVCQSVQRVNQLEQICGHIAIALLSESKDKQTLPFAAFAESVCQKGQDHMTVTYLGRIGVSLMLRYHKTHQWAKGRRVAEVLSVSKINYSTLKGLFGNEDRASRCFLVTVATELFLMSGSIEGALNILRENSWFLSSSEWPCEHADVEGRTHVLLQLAEKTSHRGTLEILCNLPGLKEPNEFVNVSNYCSAFNAHLLVCVDRQTLPVASDLVDFMLAKQLAVEPPLLQTLLQKLGRQNLWLRARELFRHSLSRGYYQGVSAPPGFMALMVPCRLGEVELALAFEMFISVNGSIILHMAENATGNLSITLKRTQSSESEYLSAGSRVLSAASIPQPKLSIRYTAVNFSQEQVFTLDTASARSWLRHNHLWANEVWAH